MRPGAVAGSLPSMAVYRIRAAAGWVRRGCGCLVRGTLLLLSAVLVALAGAAVPAAGRPSPPSDQAHLVSAFARNVPPILHDLERLSIADDDLHRDPTSRLGAEISTELGRLTADVARLKASVGNPLVLPTWSYPEREAAHLTLEAVGELEVGAPAWRRALALYLQHAAGKPGVTQEQVVAGKNNAEHYIDEAINALSEADNDLGHPEGLTVSAQPTPSEAAAPAAGLWSLANDFSFVPVLNPAPDAFGHPGVWSFLASAGSAHEPSTYSRLRRFLTDQFAIDGLDSWQGDFLSNPEDYLPQVGVNDSGVTAHYQGVEWPDGAVLAHPLPDRMAVIGWKSPVSTTVSVEGTLVLAQHPNCGNGIAWTLDAGSQTLVSGHATAAASGQFAEQVRVTRGQQLYLTIGSYQQNYFCDSTLVAWTIRTS
jgi:hypothetical protein